MARCKVSTKGNLVTITRKQFMKFLINEREWKVFEENLLPELFRPKLVRKNKIKYTAPLGISLRAYIKKGLTVHKLYSILVQIIEIIKKMENYGFYLHNLMLSDQVIHVKELTGELYFLYEPIYSKNTSTNIFAFLSDIINGIKTEDRQLKTECSEIIDFLMNPAYCRINDIEEVIKKRYPQIYQQIPDNNPLFNQQVQHLSMNLEANRETEFNSLDTILLAEEETTLLQQPMSCAHLTRRRNGQRIEVYGNEFLIGKETSLDYTISDNNAISRRHALIRNHLGEYYIVDQQSKNHTYINGRMVTNPAGEILKNGDIIKLADEEFDFRLT